MVVANQPDVVVIDKHQKTVVLIDVAIPSDSNIRKKEHEKLEKYQGLKEEIERMWGMKATVVPVVIGTLGAVTPNLNVGGAPAGFHEGCSLQLVPPEDGPRKY
ncbi:hypothetical protein D4764_10G0011710 [Takifugu flavidus]|uniref:Uncharacterized protein n=1 Tax=Takifugu flavidus TaxID=433684 RepID=A0A5C6PMR5_9TELE|nr:hypothetical protein D4764_10G0011710 [Takifugu flavidus]